MKTIKSSCGKKIQVDDKLYPYFSQFKWKVSPRGYAYRREGNAWIFMHREVLNLVVGDSALGEHRDRNRLNNQSDNLRHANQSENMINRQKYNGEHTSSLKGVHYCNRSEKWIAKIKFNGSSIYIGSYDNELRAGLNYNKKAMELFGEFAVLNDIDEGTLEPEPIVYKGVHFHTRDKKWVANGKIRGKVNHLGYHETQEEALQARNDWAKENNLPIQEWRGRSDSKLYTKKVTKTGKKNCKRV